MKATWLTAVLLAATLVAGCAGPSDSDEDPATADGCSFPDTFETTNPVALVCTNHGSIALELYADLTPQTVQNFGNLSQQGFYEDTKVHRVIEDFMVQGGDPNTADPETQSNRWGGGGPGYTIIDEFPCNDGNLSHEWTGYRSSEEPCDGHGGLAVKHDAAGTLSMANTGQPRTGGSQFFITLGATPHLDGTHTVFGQVLDGMDTVREIGGVETDCTQQGYPPGSGQGGCRDIPVEPVVVESIGIQGDLPGVEVERY